VHIQYCDVTLNMSIEAKAMQGKEGVYPQGRQGKAMAVAGSKENSRVIHHSYQECINNRALPH
jgi:hypothetical protein